MDIAELIATLTEGLPAEQAAVVKAAIERDAVKAKASGWKQQAEYDTIKAQSDALQASYTNAKQYEDWYAKNYPAITQLQKDRAAYEAKFGALDSNPPANPPANQNTPQYVTAEQVRTEASKLIQEQYAPKWADVVLKTGKIMQRHLRAKRETDIDFDALAKTANEKYAGDLDRAYDEWDKPEREKSLKAAEDSRVEQRVKEEMQKRSIQTNFPGTEQGTGAMASRTKKEVEGFDKTALHRELVSTFVEAGTVQ